jgi:hypothetical protein
MNGNNAIFSMSGHLTRAYNEYLNHVIGAVELIKVSPPNTWSESEINSVASYYCRGDEELKNAFISMDIEQIEKRRFDIFNNELVTK